MKHQSGMKEKASRRKPEAAAFHAQVSEIKPYLDQQYGVVARLFYPEIDLQRLVYAVAGRGVYWEGLPALRVAAGMEPPPAVKKLGIVVRQNA